MNTGNYILAIIDCFLGGLSLCYLAAFIYLETSPLFIGMIPKMTSIVIIGGKEIVEAACEEGENIFKTFKILLRIGVLIVIGSACLKLDGVIEWEWIKVVWPMWVMFCFILLFLAVMWGTIAIKSIRMIIIRKGEWREIKCFTWIALNFTVMAVLMAFGGVFADTFFESNFTSQIFAIFMGVCTVLLIVLLSFTLYARKDLL